MATSSFPLGNGAGMGGPNPVRAGAGGPKSAVGKARSAVNAVKHGLTSTNPVILDHETVAAWESFRDAFVADLRPVGAVEEELARDLALTQWRRRRIPLYEAQAANARLAVVEDVMTEFARRGAEDAELQRRAADVFNEALVPAAAVLDRILRYEAHLDRKFNQTLRHLERLQKARRALEHENYKTSSTPNPAPSDLSGPSVASVPFAPTLIPAQPSHSENYKTNSGAAKVTDARAAAGSQAADLGQTPANDAEAAESPERAARSLVATLAGRPLGHGSDRAWRSDAG